MRRACSVVAVAALVAVVPGCRSGNDPKAGEARLSVDGRADVRRAGSTEWREARRGTLQRGDAVRVRSGRADLRLSDGRVLELRQRSQVAVAVAPILERGDVLAVAPDRDLRIRADGVDATVSRGSARISRDVAFEAATYAGSVRMHSAGAEIRVPAYRQASIAAVGLVPSQAEPLVYRESDSWDRRFLGRWIELGRDLEARSRGITSQLQPGEGTTPGFFRLLLPQLPSERLPALLARPLPRPPGETLIGAAITSAGERGGFDDRWRAVFGFRDEGAAWGLVAADQAVRDATLTGALDEALGRFGSTLALPPPTPGGTLITPFLLGGDPGGGGPGGPATDPGGSPGTGTNPGSTPGPGGSGGTTTPPTTRPTTPPPTTPGGPPPTSPTLPTVPPTLPLPTLPVPVPTTLLPPGPPPTTGIGPADSLVGTVRGLIP